MNPYSYNISLRLWHPSIDPSEITKQLGISPKRTWVAGERRSTPKGTLLEGNNKETYWFGPIHDESFLYSEDVDLEEYLTNFTQTLQKHSNFLKEIRATGGRVEYFIGLYTDSNSGSVLPASLLLSLGELGIDLALDIYSEKTSNQLKLNKKHITRRSSSTG